MKEYRFQGKHISVSVAVDDKEPDYSELIAGVDKVLAALERTITRNGLETIIVVGESLDWYYEALRQIRHGRTSDDLIPAIVVTEDFDTEGVLEIIGTMLVFGKGKTVEV